ncbi:MAG TPA: PSD1 and planctomycete cytochrome C domain-containing protein, partial [Bryobacteraceae bacterium]|nr:PSD1 and planctomycete cytochrome C domain-containing protein [Bryobacteraceae bacterium]
MGRSIPNSLGTALFLFSSFAGAAHGQVDAANSPEFFESKVRPILAGNCFGCHTSSKMGGLRLDSSEDMLKGGTKGAAVVPGDPAKSLLIELVKHSDPKLRMPMGNKLKDADIETLTAWVKAGAVWPKSAAPVQRSSKEGDKYVIHAEQRNFWSFLPLKQPVAPAVKDAKWPKTDIDRFVLAKLEKEGLRPVRPASRRDLIRRASLDLVGLPPTAEEIAAFEKDTSPDAFAKVVDRLLASPHYGERWGRLWLDVARFGEDDYRSLDPMRRGFNPYQNAYVYRDWVVQAINDDMPYDLFVKSQLAGDLLDSKIRHKTIAGTGFLGLGPWYYDNGSAEVTRADERHDRVDAATRGFLGLTVACARCHDHKYDPIPQTDYYSIAGVFYNTQYEEYPLVPASVVKKYTDIEEEIDRKQKMLGEMQSDLSSSLSSSLAFQTANYLGGVFEVTGKDKKEMAAVVEARKLDYELLDRWVKYMAKPTEKYKYKAAWQAMMKKGGNAQEAKKLAEKFQEDVVAVMLARNELNEENKVIADKAMEGTKRKKRTNKPSNFVTNEDFCPGCSLQLKSLPEEQSNFWTEIFQRELRDNDDPNAMMAAGNRMGNPGVLLFRGWGLEARVGADAQARLKSIRDDIDASRKKLEPYYPFAHGVKDLNQTRELPLAIRGNPENLGAEVPRHFVSVLSPGEPQRFMNGSGRLELAEAILKQPISMRVIANRIWRGHFETGIVDSPSNFGMTGERPTNPELLEYLASSFAKNGMSMKKLHREIMLSSAYQLSTDNDPVAFAKDSGNRFYWRANRKRMDAEQLRDSVMFVAGDLDKSIGGPSKELTPAFKRRSVYGKVSRYKLDQYLQLFDFPNPNISAEKRFTTTVPLQRLFLMNSDFMQLEAEELAKRVATEPDNRSRIKKVYQLAFGRLPSEQEVQLGLDYLKSEPLLEYEEGKKRKPEQPAGGRRGRGGAGGPAPAGPAVSESGEGKPSESAAAADGPAVVAPAAMKPEGTPASAAELTPAPKAGPKKDMPVDGEEKA